LLGQSSISFFPQAPVEKHGRNTIGDKVVIHNDMQYSALGLSDSFGVVNIVVAWLSPSAIRRVDGTPQLLFSYLSFAQHFSGV
jgi:hypothetical protein